MDRESFYEKRDQRTEAYMEDEEMGKPVGVEVAPQVAESMAGQLLLLGLANQVARVHRRVTFAVPNPEAQMNVDVPFAKPTLGGSLKATCSEIDPFGTFRITDMLDGTEPCTLGVGQRVSGKCEWYVGACRAVGQLRREPLPVCTDSPGTLRGAALASCLGAAALFRSSHGLATTERRLSCWNYREDDNAALGPTSLGSLNVGRVLMVGAGAVGGALAYWLSAFGVSGEWSIIDPDRVELHNTNRHLSTRARDAGWDGYALGDERTHKADVAKRYLPGCAERSWYREADATTQLHDVILCLANEHDVRTKVAQRDHPVVLHATTGQSWMSQLHRHVSGRDDCIRCRTQDIREAGMKCSTAEVENGSGGDGHDAALPFLSAAAGLMLGTALQRLQAGALLETKHNDWSWDFASQHRMSTRRPRSCKDGCEVRQPPAVRKRMNEGIRWTELDPTV